MELVKYDSLNKIPGINFDGRKIFTSKKIELVLISLEPGEKVNKHAVPFDTIFFVSKGKGIVEFENNDISVNENDMIFCDKNLEHGLKNNSEDKFNVLVIKIFE
ncbi:cupin domain-containing protein [Marinitoga aeolica]|uniref:Cupin domain-containing protein n=1 Tax=Marinitoga aeolica TaxID=2809031 RepID=A0ABY8PS70_9BACT|nr:cupin domain-containing protein [Marinitoga aeolica]WGS65489.1 cupin domain-containing protein [Marinitoga aeolica]